MLRNGSSMEIYENHTNQWRKIDIHETHGNLWQRWKTMKILKNPWSWFPRRASFRTIGRWIDSLHIRRGWNRTTRKVHGMRGCQNECSINFTNIFDFENLCKSLKSIKTLEKYEKQWQSMKIYKNRWNLWKSVRILKTYENLLNPCSRSTREACQLKPH